MTIIPAAALAAVAAARVTLVIGGSDTGKTTLVARLASDLARRGHTIGVVDADLGQSDIGPPTTIGLGRVRAPIERLAQAEVIALEFLGVTSPARCMHQAADATARLGAHAFLSGCDRLLVDTCGLVEGDAGRALKRIKIARVAPDLVIALQRADECEAILGAYAGTGRPAIVRLPAAATTPRSARRGAATARACSPSTWPAPCRRPSTSHSSRCAPSRGGEAWRSSISWACWWVWTGATAGRSASAASARWISPRDG